MKNQKTTTIAKTPERIIPEDFQSLDEYLNYLRHLFAYNLALDKISSGNFVLEAGCGEGYGSSFLSEKAGKIIGLDVDNDVVNYAQNKYAQENCQFACYDGQKIPYPDNSFDIVISFQVIEHIVDDENYISEITRVLKKGGALLMTTPNRAYRLKDDQKPWNKFHVREYHGQELKSLVAGFFSEVELLGLRGNAEIQRIEQERVRSGISQFNRVPGFIKKMIPNFLIKIVKPNKKRPADNRSQFDTYSLGDFYTISEKIKEEALDLFIIARK